MPRPPLPSAVFATCLLAAPACAEDEELPPPVPGATSGAPGGQSGVSTTTGTSGSSSTSSTSGTSGGSSATTGVSTGATASGGTGGAVPMVVGEASGLFEVQGDTGHDRGFEDPADLIAIACRGEETAWVVGVGGTVLRTEDAGGRWATVPIPSGEFTLRAIALSDTRAFVVGDGGAAWTAEVHDPRFEAIDGPDVNFTGVASDDAGEHVLLTSDDGEIWTLGASDAGSALVPVQRVHQSLFAIASDRAGKRFVAVGEAGTWLESVDGGRQFTARDVPTEADLFDVALDERGRVLAVGEAGVVVRCDPDCAAQELLDPDTHLRAVHIADRGHAIAVGDAGVTFVSDREARAWTPLGLPTTFDLFGVDEIRLHGR